MRALTAQEKRTIRIAGAVLGVSLALLCGQKAWKLLHAKRTVYLSLVKEAQNLRDEIRPYESKVAVISKLMESSHMDPAKLSRATLVADASAAIQKAAASGGVQLGPIRESPAHATGKELASMQLEGIGQVTAIVSFVSFLHRLETVGFPLIVETLQMNPEASKPGMVKLSLTISILDFEQWKKEGTTPNA
jgi:hypothetical protein